MVKCMDCGATFSESEIIYDVEHELEFCPHCKSCDSLIDVTECKHKKKNGICGKSASSSGRCYMRCSHYERK